MQVLLVGAQFYRYILGRKVERGLQNVQIAFLRIQRLQPLPGPLLLLAGQSCLHQDRCGQCRCAMALFKQRRQDLQHLQMLSLGLQQLGQQNTRAWGLRVFGQGLLQRT